MNANLASPTFTNDVGINQGLDVSMSREASIWNDVQAPASGNRMIPVMSNVQQPATANRELGARNPPVNVENVFSTSPHLRAGLFNGEFSPENPPVLLPFIEDSLPVENLPSFPETGLSPIFQTPREMVPISNNAIPIERNPSRLDGIESIPRNSNSPLLNPTGSFDHSNAAGTPINRQPIASRPTDVNIVKPTGSFDHSNAAGTPINRQPIASRPTDVNIVNPTGSFDHSNAAGTPINRQPTASRPTDANVATGTSRGGSPIVNGRPISGHVAPVTPVHPVAQAVDVFAQNAEGNNELTKSGQIPDALVPLVNSGGLNLQSFQGFAEFERNNILGQQNQQQNAQFLESPVIRNKPPVPTVSRNVVGPTLTENPRRLPSIIQTHAIVTAAPQTVPIVNVGVQSNIGPGPISAGQLLAIDRPIQPRVSNQQIGQSGATNGQIQNGGVVVHPFPQGAGGLAPGLQFPGGFMELPVEVPITTPQPTLQTIPPVRMAELERFGTSLLQGLKL